jgi:drug/metabolite transporter (DMT)-like permease
MKPEFKIIIAAILLASIGILTKLIGADVHPGVIAFYRVFFAMITLAILCPIVDKTTFKPLKKDLGMYAIIGLVFAVNLGLSTYVYLKAPIQNLAAISSSAPFFVLILGYFILREKITKTKIITLAIAIVGLLIINPFKVGGEILVYGIALFLALLDATLIVLMRKENTTHPVGDVFWFFFFASIFLLPFPIIFGLGKLSIYVFIIGLITTGFGYFFYNLGLEKLEAETGSIISTITYPIASVIFAVIILSEKLNPTILIGGAILIVSGVYLETHNKTLKAKGIHKRKWPSKRFLRLKKR